MSQLFAAVYDINSSAINSPALRLNLIVNAQSAIVVGHAEMRLSDTETAGMSVRGHHVEIDGERPLHAIVLAGVPSIFPSDDEMPSAFQLLMVLPSPWKSGQVCYRMSFGSDDPRVVEVRDGVPNAILMDASMLN
jgi:hypothetical protein